MWFRKNIAAPKCLPLVHHDIEKGGLQFWAVLSYHTSCGWHVIHRVPSAEGLAVQFVCAELKNNSRADFLPPRDCHHDPLMYCHELLFLWGLTEGETRRHKSLHSTPSTREQQMDKTSTTRFIYLEPYDRGSRKYIWPTWLLQDFQISVWRW